MENKSCLDPRFLIIKRYQLSGEVHKETVSMFNVSITVRVSVG